MGNEPLILDVFKKPPVEGVSADQGMIFNVQRFSSQDGPGIRSTVFFKGCPLHCPWCHNPEGICATPEVVVSEGRCIHCDLCIDECPESIRPAAVTGNHDCLRCGDCADICPTGAREFIGRQVSVEEVIERVIRDRIFYDDSGGGVTFSGGEPLAQAQFLLSCLQACRAEGLRTALDTSGCGRQEDLLSASGFSDVILFDLKIMDEAMHQDLLGVPLQPILANLEALAKIHPEVWLRVPIVPGFSDSCANVDAIIDFAAANSGIRRVNLLPYHRSGAGKHTRLGREDTMHGVEPPSAERMRDISERFAFAGLQVSIGG